MDYEVMLDFHKANNADVTIAVMPVPMEEASRFGIVDRLMIMHRSRSSRRNRSIQEAIWLPWVSTYSTWKVLKEALIKLSDADRL